MHARGLNASTATRTAWSKQEDAHLVCRRLVRRRTLVVSIAPDDVPDGRYDDGADENHRGIVDGGSLHGNNSGHAEDGYREHGPGC